MKASVKRLQSGLLLFIVNMGLVFSGQIWAQTATIDFERATLVSKFAKYVSWPNEARQSDFIIGVYEDVEKYEYFKGFFTNKGVKNKDISVRLLTSLTEAKDVNILYMSSPKQRDLSKFMERVIDGSPVLVISEDTKDLSKTMVDISYDPENAKISVKVIDANIVDGELIMPELSNLLANNSDGEVLSLSPTFIKKEKHSKQLLAFQDQLEKQKSELEQLTEELALSKENSDKYYLALQKQAANLKLTQQSETKKRQEVNAKNAKLKQLQAQLKAQEEQLKQQNQLSTEGSDLQVVDDSKAKEQEVAILELTEKLKTQSDIANNTVKELATVNKENKSLSKFQMLFYVFVVIAVIGLVIAYIMWKKTKELVLQPATKAESKGNPLLPIREQQLMKSENLAALGYIATDVTYVAGLSLDDLLAELESTGDAKHVAALKSVTTLLDNFNVIAADQDDNKVQSFDIAAYIQKMLMLYDFEFNQSNITYHYSGEQALTVKSVPSYIALVLLHLINNSLKHGFDNNGNGKITLKLEKEAKGGAKITYSDDGKGMSKTILKQVFEPFFTTHNDRDYVGVGMSTAYDLVKNKLSGDIKIDSQEGKGTTVTITLT